MRTTINPTQMPYIVKKLVPVYSEKDRVPKQWKNLRKLKHVTTFKYLYPNVKDILIKEYGLKPSDKIVIYFMKEISLPHFNRYRTKFRKVFSDELRILNIDRKS